MGKRVSQFSVVAQRGHNGVALTSTLREKCVSHRDLLKRLDQSRFSGLRVFRGKSFTCSLVLDLVALFTYHLRP